VRESHPTRPERRLRWVDVNYGCSGQQAASQRAPRGMSVYMGEKNHVEGAWGGKGGGGMVYTYPSRRICYFHT